MATSPGPVPFALDGSSLSPVHNAVAGGAPSAVEVALLAVGVAVVLVGVVGVLAYVRDAETRIDRELREVALERDAYRSFAERVSRIQVGQTSSAMATPQTVQTFAEDGPPIESVQSAFEDTVMAVDHYEATYGEPWIDHVRAELDVDLATTLESARVVNPPIKLALERQALEAASRRDELLAVLSTERSEIDEATESLEAIQARIDELAGPDRRDRDFDQLRADYEALEDLGEDIERLQTRRQRRIHRTTRNPSFEPEEFALQEYLYASMETMYPVLDATVRLDDRLHAAKRRLVHALTSTV